MQLQERVRQEASIDESGKIVLGDALPGYDQLALVAFSRVPYLLTNADGSQVERGYAHLQPESVPLDRTPIGSSFDPETTGLTFSVVVPSTALVATTGLTAPDVGTADNATALGPQSFSNKKNSTALGAKAMTAFTNEVAFGVGSGQPWESTVSCRTFVEAESSAVLATAEMETLAFTTTSVFGTADLAPGIAVIKGVLTAVEADIVSAGTWDTATIHAYEITLVLRKTPGDDECTLVGSVTKTNLISGGPDDLSFSYSATTGELTVANADTSIPYEVSGVLRITRTAMLAA